MRVRGSAGGVYPSTGGVGVAVGGGLPGITMHGWWRVPYVSQRTIQTFGRVNELNENHVHLAIAISHTECGCPKQCN